MADDFIVVLPGNTARFEPPEGMESYLDGDTVRFRPIQPDPAHLLELSASVPTNSYRRVYERYDGSVLPGRWQTAWGNPQEGSPTVRKVRHCRIAQVVIAHPDERWVEEAWESLEYFVDYQLGDRVEENIQEAGDG